MRIIKGIIKEDFNNNFLWSKITFKSNNGKDISSVFFCAPKNYFRNNNISFDQKNIWVEDIINKWKVLDKGIFNQKIHYDVYSKDPSTEIKCLSFLMKKNPYALSFF